ncbi:MAG: HDIG domain-containing protein, partial [Bacteroidales bacterium]|nr:HDIG domain-containing protein [Bacteroidales bacterium]
MKQTVRLNKVFPALIVVALLAAIAPRAARFDYDYKKGGTWEYETLFAPFDFPVLKTADQIRDEMDKATDVYVPYYNSLPDVTASSLRKASDLQLGGLDSLVAASLASIMDRGVVSDDALPQDSDVIYIQRDKRAVKVPADNILGLSVARSKLLAEIQAQVDTMSVDSLLKASSVYNLVVPNLVFDSQTTDAVNADAASRISPTRGYVSAGQLIVSKGEIVTAEIAQILDSYKKEYEANIGSSRPVYLEVLGNFLVALILVVLLLIVIYYSNADIFSDSRYYYLLFVFTLAAVTILLITRFDSRWLYITPLTLAALYLQAFVRGKVIIPVYIISLMPLLIYADHGSALFIIFLVGGIVSIIGFPALGKGWKQFVLALMTFASMALAYLALRLTGAVGGVVFPDLLRLFIASMLAVAGYPLIYLFEKIFNLVSNSRLSELADTSSKLLRELEQKAPGTFQHSLQVMNMADAAARSIDANPLLLRVGALYHDIGKMNNPMCFIENESMLNKSEDQKYHTGLPPQQSAEDIIRHVTDGVEMARKHRLPDVVVD